MSQIHFNSKKKLNWGQSDDKKQELLSNISDKESFKEEPKREDFQSRASDKDDIKEDPKSEDFDEDDSNKNHNNILSVSSYSKNDPTNKNKKKGTFYSNLNDMQNKNFINFPHDVHDDGDQIQRKNKAEIQNINEDINIEKGNNEGRNNINSTKSNTTALFVTYKKTDDDKDIPFKKEECKKTLRVRIINESLHKLNNYIKKSTNLPRRLKNKINKVTTKLISKVSNRYNKKFWKMRFRRILSFGKNRITKKDNAYNNYVNIINIIRYIKEYKAKNNKLPQDLLRIKKLLYMRPENLIKMYSKSKKFNSFRKEEIFLRYQKGLLNEVDKIDISTEKGLINLLKPFEDNKSKSMAKKQKKKSPAIYRKCLHSKHK